MFNDFLFQVNQELRRRGLGELNDETLIVLGNVFNDPQHQPALLQGIHSGQITPATIVNEVQAGMRAHQGLPPDQVVNPQAQTSEEASPRSLLLRSRRPIESARGRLLATPERRPDMLGPQPLLAGTV